MLLVTTLLHKPTYIKSLKRFRLKLSCRHSSEITRQSFSRKTHHFMKVKLLFPKNSETPSTASFPQKMFVFEELLWLFTSICFYLWIQYFCDRRYNLSVILSVDCKFDAIISTSIERWIHLGLYWLNICYNKSMELRTFYMSLILIFCQSQHTIDQTKTEDYKVKVPNYILMGVEWMVSSCCINDEPESHKLWTPPGFSTKIFIFSRFYKICSS